MLQTATIDEITRCLQVLELEPGADLDQIRRAFRDLAMVWHPDRFADNERLRAQAEDKLKRINQAYEYLKNLSPQDLTLDSIRRDTGSESNSSKTKKAKRQTGSNNNSQKAASDGILVIKLVELARDCLSSGLYDRALECYREALHEISVSAGRFSEQYLAVDRDP